MPTGEIQNVDLFQSRIQNIISGLKSNGNPANNSRTKIYFFHLCAFLFPIVYQQKVIFPPLYIRYPLHLHMVTKMIEKHTKKFKIT